MTHLALCHSVVIDNKTGKYCASSPDELALITGAKEMGVEFISRDENNIVSIEFAHNKQVKQYKILSTLEFSSARKRMSIIA